MIFQESQAKCASCRYFYMSVFLLVGETYDDLSLQKMDEYFQITLADFSSASPIVPLLPYLLPRVYTQILMICN